MAFECVSKAMALTALDTIAASLTGTQREAVLTVKAWIRENTSEGFTDEVREKLDKIFNGGTKELQASKRAGNRTRRTL